MARWCASGVGRSASFASTLTHLRHAYCVTSARDTSRRRPLVDRQPISFNAMKQPQRARGPSTCNRMRDHDAARRALATVAFISLLLSVGICRMSSGDQPLVQPSACSYTIYPGLLLLSSRSLTELTYRVWRTSAQPGSLSMRSARVGVRSRASIGGPVVSRQHLNQPYTNAIRCSYGGQSGHREPDLTSCRGCRLCMRLAPGQVRTERERPV